MVRKGVIVEIEREHGRSKKGWRGRKVATALFSLWVFQTKFTENVMKQSKQREKKI